MHMYMRMHMYMHMYMHMCMCMCMHGSRLYPGVVQCEIRKISTTP